MSVFSYSGFMPPARDDSDEADEEIRGQLVVLHPHLASQLHQSVEDLIAAMYPTTNPIAVPQARMNRGLRAEPTPNETPMSEVHEHLSVAAGQSVPGSPPSIFPTTQNSGDRATNNDTYRALPLYGPSQQGEARSTSYQTEHWLPYSMIWGPAGHQAEPSLQTNAPEPLPLPGSAETVENINNPPPSTRAIRTGGPAEIINPEFLQWFWRRKFDFILERVINNSRDNATGDISFYFETEDHAERAYEAMKDPELSDCVAEPITVEFLREL
ncbi:hypothetical protein V8F20_007430 [Naviculisporaceae sp. PSN 640]